MKLKHLLVVSLLGLFLSDRAAALTIDFNDLTVGDTLSNQYANQGITFSANALVGPDGPTGPWGTKTDLTVIDVAGNDAGGLGVPALMSGLIVHSFNGWLAEDGDPSLRIDFSTPVSKVSLDFAGVTDSENVRMLFYDGATLLGEQRGTQTGQITLGASAPSITSVVIVLGSFNDWIAFDNLNYEPVP